MIFDHISVFLPCFLLFVICGTDSQYVPMLIVTPLDPRGSGLLFFMFIRPQPYTTCLGIECPTVHPDTRQPICRFTVSRPPPLFRLWFHPRCTGVCIFVPCGILLRWCPRVLRASEWSDGRSALSSVARVCLYYIVPLNVRGHHRRSGGSVSLSSELVFIFTYRGYPTGTYRQSSKALENPETRKARTHFREKTGTIPGLGKSGRACMH